MAWVKLPCVCNKTLSGGWHVELQILIVLGGGVNVECISSVWRPAGVDSGVVVNEAFCIDWRNWSHGSPRWQICWDHSVRNREG
jgi:hypothetical protein